MLEGVKGGMLNFLAARGFNQPAEVMAALDIKPGEHVAEIGPGGGYYSLCFAEAVGPEGRVYAIDINEGFLRSVARKARAGNLDNLVIVPGDRLDEVLPKKDLDIVFLRITYHCMKDRVAYFKAFA